MRCICAVLTRNTYKLLEKVQINLNLKRLTHESNFRYKAIYLSENMNKTRNEFNWKER